MQNVIKKIDEIKYSLSQLPHNLAFLSNVDNFVAFLKTYEFLQNFGQSLKTAFPDHQKKNAWRFSSDFCLTDESFQFPPKLGPQPIDKSSPPRLAEVRADE